MIRQRNTQLGERFLNALNMVGDDPNSPMSAASRAQALLIREGFRECPSWQELWEGARPPQPEATEPGEWAHGWQFHAATAREHHFRSTELFPTISRAQQALLRSQSGPGSGLAFHTAPTAQELYLSPERFRALAFRRLRWPLPLAEASCEGCGSAIDSYGDHRCACMRSGRVQLRAPPLEHVTARICREAGARVQTNVFLRNLNLNIPASDDRRVEVVASGLPCYHGAQLAIDVTLYSCLNGNGDPRPRATWQNGAALQDARDDKEKKYPELTRSARSRLVVLALETGGRLSTETVDFLLQLARARARMVPSYLRQASTYAFFRRWTRLLAVTAANALAASLLEDRHRLAAEPALDGGLPWLLDMLAECRHDDAPIPSSMPLRPE